MNDLIYASATTIANSIKTKEVSSEEVVNAHLERIQEINPKLNAIVQLTAPRLGRKLVMLTLF